MTDDRMPKDVRIEYHQDRAQGDSQFLRKRPVEWVLGIVRLEIDEIFLLFYSNLLLDIRGILL